MHNRPLVTVGMVCRNSQAYVADAIDSVLAQDFQNFELLVCDDASADDTWEIVSGYSDRRIARYRNAAACGESACRNQILARARGQYLIYIDGDDFAYPYALGFMARALGRFPQAGFACARPPSQKFIYPVQLHPHDYCACMFFGPRIAAEDLSQLMFRSTCLREAGGFDSRALSIDTCVQLSTGARHGCVLISNGLVWWRRSGPLGTGAARAARVAAELARLARTTLEDWDCPLSADETHTAQSFAYRQALRELATLASHGSVREAATLLQTAAIPLSQWKHCLSAVPAPYFATVGGLNPLRTIAGQRMTLAVASPIAPPRKRLARDKNIRRQAELHGSLPLFS